MSDHWSTLRSDYYRRPYPYTGTGGEVNPESVSLEMAKELANLNDKGKTSSDKTKSVSGEDTVIAELKRQALLKTNPWLEPLLREVAKARLAMLGSNDEWAQSKDYGWGHKLNMKDIPDDTEYFQLKSDPETGEIWIDDTDLAKDLIYADEQGKTNNYATSRKVFEDFIKEPYTQELAPMTRDEAKSSDVDWYPTTNEFLNALIETKLGEGNKEPLYDAAQVIFSQILDEDLKSENPKYREAFKKILNDDGTQDRQFKTANGVGYGLLDTVFPFVTSVVHDPELWQKTGKGELAMRGLADAGLNAASIALPFGGAARGASLLGKPVLGSIAGGAAGGLANYGLKRGANQAFDVATGHGGIHTPISLLDAGLETGFGGLSGAMSHLPKTFAKRSLKEMMKRSDKSSVTRKDVNESLKLTKHFGDKESAREPFISKSFEKYNNKYPNSAMEVEMFPKLEADLPLQLNQPEGNILGEVGKLGGENSNKIVIGAKIGGKKKELPIAYAHGDDPEFYTKYIKRNPEFFKNFIKPDMPDNIDIGKLARLAQLKESEYTPWFTGGKQIMPSNEYAENLAKFSGRNFDDERKITSPAIMKLLRNNPKVGNKVGDKFEEAGKKQLKEYGKARDRYNSRVHMKLVDETDLKNASKGWKRNLATKAPAGALQLFSNNAPLSNWILDVPPYTYEAYDSKE